MQELHTRHVDSLKTMFTRNGMSCCMINKASKFHVQWNQVKSLIFLTQKVRII